MGCTAGAEVVATGAVAGAEVAGAEVVGAEEVVGAVDEGAGLEQATRARLASSTVTKRIAINLFILYFSFLFLFEIPLKIESIHFQI